MSRELLIHLPIVQAVAKYGGFASAASALDMSPSSVSHAIRVVEDSLGEPLFARTTRSVSLTEAGAKFLSAVGPALEDIEKAIENVAERRGEISGLLRLNVPRVAAQFALIPILKKLAVKHPMLTIEIHTEDALVNIIELGFDAGIRLGDSIEQDMVSVRLTPPFKAIMVASPEYLKINGYPKSIQELDKHNCIGFRFLKSGALYDWELQDRDKKIFVKTNGSIVITDATFAKDIAMAGIGIAYVYEPLIQQELKQGSLIRILSEFNYEESGLFMYFPQRTSLAPKLRAFIDTAKSCLKIK